MRPEQTVEEGQQVGLNCSAVISLSVLNVSLHSC